MKRGGCAARQLPLWTALGNAYSPEAERRDLQGVEPGQYRITAASNGEYTDKYRVESWHGPARPVTGSDRLGSGALSVADPRLPTEHGANSSSNMPAAVADPRIGHTPRKGVYGIGRWDRPAGTVIGSASVRGSNGMAAVADPRLDCAPRSGAYRVVRGDEPAPTVTGAGDVHAQGAAAVADPRLPADHEQGAWVIVAEDGTWHRPLTTLELAALQGFPTTMPDGRPLTLAGKSQARWRERIGNAVPPPAARGIAEMMLLALLPATAGAWVLSPLGTAIWVRAVLRARLQAGWARMIFARSRSRRLGSRPGTKGGENGC